MTASKSMEEVPDRYKDPLADVTLISSDGAEFKVYGYHLMSASTVFCDMLKSDTTSVSNGRRIPLVDTDFERRQNIEDLLDMLLGRGPDAALGHLERSQKLILLLQKYDCLPAIESLKKPIRLFIARPTLAISSYNLFLLCAILDYPLGCKEAITTAGKSRWNHEAQNVASLGQASHRQHLLNHNPMKIAAMKEDHLALLPTRYVLGLARAAEWRDSKGEPNWERGADEFYRIVTGYVISPVGSVSAK